MTGRMSKAIWLRIYGRKIVLVSSRRVKLSRKRHLSLKSWAKKSKTLKVINNHNMA